MRFDDSAYRDKPGWVYLIHARGTRRFKIGLTTRSVEQRLAELNGSQSPYPLDLWESIPTDNVTETEAYLHAKFARLRVHGEWFEFSNRQLREVVKEFDRIENGDRFRFRLPSLPSIPLPSLGSLPRLPAVNPNRAGLALAAVGATWLMLGFSGCFEPPPPQPAVIEQR
jgi:hypothetical protein